MRVYRCELTLLENTFFSSREVGNFYQTEPFIGNYALCYALGLIHAPYANDGTIYYGEHLASLNERGIYITPATLIGQPRFAVQQFNAMPDSYWYAMGNNALITKPDGWQIEKRGSAWYLIDPATGKGRKARTANRPQIGRIKMLSIGNRALFYVLAAGDAPRLPSYLRLGKWMSKARLAATEVKHEAVTREHAEMKLLLSPLDLSPTATLQTFDLLNVHPVPLLRNAVISGDFYRLPADTLLPADMHFNVEVLPS